MYGGVPTELLKTSTLREAGVNAIFMSFDSINAGDITLLKKQGAPLTP